MDKHNKQAPRIKPTADIKFFQSKYNEMAGTSYCELINKAHAIVNALNPNHRRKENVHCGYYSGEKIFFEYFWQHQSNKPPADKMRRIRFFQCAVDLLQNTTYAPNIEPSGKNSSELWLSFYGKTKSGVKFVVHLKSNQRGNKYLMSIFPL
jgi:hypothetical protein